MICGTKIREKFEIFKFYPIVILSRILLMAFSSSVSTTDMITFLKTPVTALTIASSMVFKILWSVLISTWIELENKI